MKLNSLFVLSILAVLNSTFVSAQSDNVVGTNHYIDSQILEEKRQIQIHLPDGYEASDKSYPVLYLLDGQQFFTYGVSLSRTFKQFDLTPEFIIVGITTRYPQRYGHYGNGKDKFIEFMEKELLTFVDKNYRTKTERLLFGWQYAGSLAFHIMVDYPSLFDGYFIASPFPLEQKVNDLDKISTLNKTIYFGVSPDEYQVNMGTNKLDSLLSNKNIDNLDWSYLQFEKEEHRSTAYPTLYHSLRGYFKYYPQLQVDNLKKFLDLGGLNYAHEYAKKRGLIYGFDPSLTTWSKYTIIRSAIRANDISNFQSFNNELLTDEFIIDLDRRTYDITSFYEKHNQFDKAIHIYTILLKKHPESERLLTNIANAHTALGNTKEAKKFLKKAKSLSGK